VSSSDFRQIAARTETGRAERLFRAAISAFCSLTRPSRREIGQLDDLVLPLFDEVSTDGLRFAAAALSECETAPDGIVKRLSEAEVKIAAPLLIRSRALTDVDLISLIGRHGLPHARAIARRENLHPAIASLIRAMERQAQADASRIHTSSPYGLQIVAKPPAKPVTKGRAGEETRQRLRDFMAQRSQLVPANTGIYAKLRNTAFSGNPALFHTALADALGIGIATARTLTGSTDYSPLMTGLHKLGLSESEAFLIVCAVCPGRPETPQDMASFLERYRHLDRDEVARKVTLWGSGS
jgi:uncharacterized protein (DUF2336 family)